MNEIDITKKLRELTENCIEKTRKRIEEYLKLNLTETDKLALNLIILDGFGKHLEGLRKVQKELNENQEKQS